MALPSIINVYPANGSKGIVLSDTIRVTFNQEMDTTSINSGTFIVGGPDNSSIFSPLDITPFDLPGLTEENKESFPYFAAPISGTITFKRVDIYGNEIDDSIKDYNGDGSLWRTQAIFTPSVPLEPNKDYFVLIAGDEDTTDAFDSGVKSRSIFDTEKTAGTGNANLNFYGTYTGNSNQEYVIKFISAGTVGVATYQWWKKSDPLTVYNGISTTGERELEDGVMVTCDPDGSFAIGDQFEVLVLPGVPLENNYKWEFSTSNGAIEVPPSTSPASGIESITTSTGISEQFHVSSISPIEGYYGLEISDSLYIGEQIVITLSEDVDSTTVEDNISIISEQVIVDSTITATGILEWTGTVSGGVITINLDPAQLYNNNIIIVKIGTGLKNTDGDSLGSVFTSYFTTPYTPLYTNEHRIYLDLGALVSDIPESTIMAAILEASFMADGITFTSIVNSRYYELARREFVTCMAELILLRGLSGNAALSSKMSKTLGDLKVSRDGGSLKISDKIEDKEDCIARWQQVLTTGGELTPGNSLKPIYAVKGRTAIDAIQVGREWCSGHGISGYSRTGASNTSINKGGRRRIKTFRKRII